MPYKSVQRKATMDQHVEYVSNNPWNCTTVNTLSVVILVDFGEDKN